VTKRNTVERGEKADIVKREKDTVPTRQIDKSRETKKDRGCKWDGTKKRESPIAKKPKERGWIALVIHAGEGCREETSLKEGRITGGLSGEKKKEARRLRSQKEAGEFSQTQAKAGESVHGEG